MSIFMFLKVEMNFQTPPLALMQAGQEDVLSSEILLKAAIVTFSSLQKHTLRQFVSQLC